MAVVALSAFGLSGNQNDNKNCLYAALCPHNDFERGSAMTSRKPSSNRTRRDARRVNTLDMLRAKSWINHIVDLSGLTTYYRLADRFGGERSQWKNYSTGGQPTEPVLDRVELVLPGSSNVYLSGPNNLKLWPALAEDDLQILSLIVDHSTSCDALVAAFKRQVISDPTIVLKDGWPYFPCEYPLKDDLLEIWACIHFELDSQIADGAMNVLLQWFEEILEGFSAPIFANTEMNISPLYYRDEAIVALERKRTFDNLSMPTVGRKGIWTMVSEGQTKIVKSLP
jgi:hypothetical protein